MLRRNYAQLSSANINNHFKQFIRNIQKLLVIKVNDALSVFLLSADIYEQPMSMSSVRTTNQPAISQHTNI